MWLFWHDKQTLFIFIDIDYTEEYKRTVEKDLGCLPVLKATLISEYYVISFTPVASLVSRVLRLKILAYESSFKKPTISYNGYNQH